MTHDSFWTQDTPLSWLAMYLLAIPIGLLCAAFAALCLVLLGLNWITGRAISLLDGRW